MSSYKQLTYKQRCQIEALNKSGFSQQAIGYEWNGDVMPGWGPLTELHNTTFATLDVASINAKLVPNVAAD